MTCKATENRLKYLSLIASNSQVNNVLKSYYMSKCFKFSTAENVRIESKFTDKIRKCELCLIPYNNPTCCLRSERKPGKFIKKLLKKKSLKTKFQQKYLENNTKAHINGNSLEIICTNCNKSNIKLLQKPLRIQNIPEKVIVKKQKSRKRDAYCGLNPDIVNSVKIIKTDNPKKTLQSGNLIKNKKTVKAKQNKLIKLQAEKKEKKCANMKNRLGSALDSKPSNNVSLKSFLKQIS